MMANNNVMIQTRLVVLVVVTLSLVSAQCFYGTTDSCRFTCHCQQQSSNSSSCAQERSLNSGSCSTGCYGAGSTPSYSELSNTWSGPGCQIGNIALNKPTWQSNNTIYGHSDDRRGAAEQCVDGRVDGGSCCGFYKYGINYTWGVDLLEDHVITRISLYGDLEGDLEGVAFREGITITFMYSNHTITSEDYINTRYADMNGLSTTHEYNSSNYAIARYITVSGVPSDIYAMCEVEVLGYQYWECSEEYNGGYYYGPGCLLPCNNCMQQCDVITGACDRCMSGYTGNRCNVECMDGTFGEGCVHKCNCRDSSEVCDKRTGQCAISGCRSGYSGEACNLVQPSSYDNAIVDVEARMQHHDNIAITLQLDMSVLGNDTLYIHYRNTAGGWSMQELHLHDVNKQPKQRQTQKYLTVVHTLQFNSSDLGLQGKTTYQVCISSTQLNTPEGPKGFCTFIHMFSDIQDGSGISAGLFGGIIILVFCVTLMLTLAIGYILYKKRLITFRSSTKDQENTSKKQSQASVDQHNYVVQDKPKMDDPIEYEYCNLAQSADETNKKTQHSKTEKADMNTAYEDIIVYQNQQQHDQQKQYTELQL